MGFVKSPTFCDSPAHMAETASGQAIRHRMTAERARTDAAESAAETASAKVSASPADQYQLCPATRPRAPRTGCLGDRGQGRNAERSYDGENHQPSMSA
jgi:hypothetical protein